jgi:hypothetical protein
MLGTVLNFIILLAVNYGLTYSSIYYKYKKGIFWAKPDQDNQE